MIHTESAPLSLVRLLRLRTAVVVLAVAAGLLALLPGRSDAYVLSAAWSDRSLTYAVANGTPDIASTLEQVAIDDAVATWRRAIAEAGVSLTLTKVTDPASADIVFSFVTGDHGDGYPFPSTGEAAIAHAFQPPATAAERANPGFGDVHFNDANTFSLSGTTATTFGLESVALHELGHALGLRHSDVPSALMSSLYYNRTSLTYTADEVAGLRALYGG